MKSIKFGLVASVLIAGLAMAATPEVTARKDLMKNMGGSMKALGEMAGGATAFDATAAQAAKQSLVDHSAKIEAMFTANVEDPDGKASPDVWANWDDFLAKAKSLNDAAAKIDVTSAETIGATMGEAGGACKSCHMAYKM